MAGMPCYMLVGDCIVLRCWTQSVCVIDGAQIEIEITD